MHTANLRWVIGVVVLLTLTLSASTMAGTQSSDDPWVYTEGISYEEYTYEYNQTLCYDWIPVKGTLANAIQSELVIEMDGLYYGANAGVTWGSCPTLIDGGPVVYVTSCTESIGAMQLTRGYNYERGWITDINGHEVTYLMYSAEDHPCDASSIGLFDDSKYPNWVVACENEPVLFLMDGQSFRCDINPIQSGNDVGA